MALEHIRRIFSSFEDVRAMNSKVSRIRDMSPQINFVITAYTLRREATDLLMLYKTIEQTELLSLTLSFIYI